MVVMKTKKRINNLKPIKRRVSSFTDEDIGKALKNKHGLQSMAADLLGCSDAYISQRISESPYLQKIRVQAFERRLDIAELSLTDLTVEKDLGAICFTLKTIGKKRGYTETTQLGIAPEHAESTKTLLSELFKLQGEHKSQVDRKIEESKIISEQ